MDLKHNVLKWVKGKPTDIGGVKDGIFYKYWQSKNMCYNPEGISISKDVFEKYKDKFDEIVVFIEDTNEVYKVKKDIFIKNYKVADFGMGVNYILSTKFWDKRNNKTGLWEKPTTFDEQTLF